MNFSEAMVIPVIMSIIELAKGLGLPKKYSAVAAVIVGALMGVFFVEPDSFRIGLFKGIVYGLTASGIYSGAKNTYEQVMNNKERNNKNAH